MIEILQKLDKLYQVEDINQPDNYGKTALYWTAVYNNLEMV